MELRFFRTLHLLNATIILIMTSQQSWHSVKISFSLGMVRNEFTKFQLRWHLRILRFLRILLQLNLISFTHIHHLLNTNCISVLFAYKINLHYSQLFFDYPQQYINSKYNELICQFRVELCYLSSSDTVIDSVRIVCNVLMSHYHVPNNLRANNRKTKIFPWDW